MQLAVEYLGRRSWRQTFAKPNTRRLSRQNLATIWRRTLTGTAGGCPAPANSLALKTAHPGDNDVNCPPSSIEQIRGHLSSSDPQIEALQEADPDR